MRKLSYIVGSVLVLALTAALAGRWYIGTSARTVPEARVPGLRDEVEVWRDSLGVPHLWASGEEDLARALGFVHAQDRLWQMELFRRVADGRLAEVLGEEALEADRFLRTLGMGRAAERDEAQLNDAERRVLSAYSEGVNAFVSGRAGALPPEFLLLRSRPERWTVRNSLAIAKIMAWDLADWQTGLDLQHAVDRVGPELARLLVPAYPEWGTRILTSAPPGSSRPMVPVTRAPARVGAVPPVRPVPALAAALLDGLSVSKASNSWVVGGARTRSGKPILANDPHLELRAPSLWYLAALHGGPVDVAGVTIPGLPVVVLGRTSRVAWGFTNAMVDDVDFFVERLAPGDSTRYLTPEGARSLEVRAETIQVRGGSPVVMRVRSTRHGPVVSEVEERTGDRLVAMQWTAQQPSTSYRAMRAMNQARSAEHFVRALRDFNDPHQNVVFADADGSFGYWMVGRVPVRRAGDGLLPAPGWTGEADWTGFVGFDRHPHALNPADGFVVTANNAQAGPWYPHYIGSYYAPPYRAERIREMLLADRSVTATDAALQQMDVRDRWAQRYLPFALAAARAAGSDSALRALRRWDGQAQPGSHAAAIFYVWYEELRRRVGDDEYRGARVFFPRYALDRILDAGGGAWVDDVRTTERETLDELSADAMRAAIEAVGDRTWGEVHRTAINHALGSVRLLDRTLRLNLDPFPAGGSPNTVNVAGYGARLPFTNTNGPSMRHVADLADPDGAGGFVIPTGQSGLPVSPHYRDQTGLWRAGRLRPIPLDRRRAERMTATRTTLRP